MSETQVHDINQVVIDFTHIDKAPEHYFAAALGWYFHGELEEQVGYDIPAASVDLRELKDGIYKGTWEGQSCTFFCWSYVEDYNLGSQNNPEFKKNRHRGLIVLDTDHASMADARKKYSGLIHNL